MNTTNLYRTIAAFMTARSEAIEEYRLMTRRYEAAKGSKLYSDKMDEARKKRDKTISDAQFIAKQEIRETLKAMAEKADKIALQAPTAEQIRLLQLLKMKDRLTEAECTGAANAMNGNAACLALVDELARKSGVLHTSYVNSLAVKTYSPETARMTIKALGESCFDIVNNTTGASKPALLAKQWHQNVHGSTFDPYELPQEEPFKDESDFYEQMNIPLSAFSSAVD